MRMWFRLPAVFLLLATAVAGVGDAAQVAVLKLDDTIQPASRAYLERALGDAVAGGSVLAVVELNTPGGLLSSTRRMTTAITSCAVPVVVYVAPSGAQAASAGFFILQAADVAAMTPGTNAGAAHPVGGKGENLPEDVRKKATNDAAALIRSLAQRRGRNSELAEKAVTESLSFTAREALEKHLVDRVAASRAELYAQLEGTTVHRFDGSEVKLTLKPVSERQLPPTAGERFLSTLANPNVAYLLMALAMIGIYTEVTHPGGVLPGVVGVIALLLGLYSLSVLPVNLAGVALMVVAFLLWVLEVKVTSYGLLTVGGLVSFVLGSLMLFDSPIPDLRVSLKVILPAAVTIAAVVLFLLGKVVAAHRRRPLTGVEGMVGEEGTALSELDPEGKVLVHGEYWDARCDGRSLPAGARVRVLAVEGRHLNVEPVEDQGGK